MTSCTCPGPVKVAIVGSRRFANLQAVRDLVYSLPPGTIVVSGGASGVDRTAEIACAGRVLGLVSHWPDWKAHGKPAGFIRNRAIVAELDGPDDVLHAFWDGASSGTKSTIQLANHARKRVTIHR